MPIRHSILVLLFSIIAPSVTFADAYKCRAENGKTIISSIPCQEASVPVSVQRSDNIQAQQYQNAVNDLERQKQYLKMREREQQSSRVTASNTNPHQGTGNAYDPDTRDRIHSCLMKITATMGLSSGEIARRKVYCYVGTKGLADECEGRITATGG
mgnify:FL=1